MLGLPLVRLDCPNLAVPTRVWCQDGRVYEELPYVGGIRLSQAVVPRHGRLGGKLLEDFCWQMGGLIHEIHEAGVIHRDIHPDNIYLVARRADDEDSRPARSHRHEDSWVSHSREVFRLRFVIVDHTFAILAKDGARAAPVVHGSYTPEEQALGLATPASDLYAFGATIYYAIEGREIPPFARRRAEPSSLGPIPSGHHSSRQFERYLPELLSLDPPKRALRWLQPDTWQPTYSGALSLSRDQILITDSRLGPRIMDRQQALAFFVSIREEGAGGLYDQVCYWIAALK